MKLTLLAFALFMSSFHVVAQSPSLSEAHFCHDRKNPDFVKSLTMDPHNLMSFRNRGGIGMAGVCWWHSRFQRNALYLTYFKPELPRPSILETLDIIKQIRNAENVIAIPGFNNFFEFSEANKKHIQQELEDWQKYEGIQQFSWIDGLAGESIVSPSKLKKILDHMFVEVEINKHIVFNKLQIKGIAAHSWLVVHMKKFKGGYDLEILDSNAFGYLESYRYYEGAKFLVYHNYNEEVSAETLQNLMDTAYEQREMKKNFHYNLTFPGFEFYHWTAQKMVKVKNGYDLKILIYSKDHETQKIVYKYRYGDKRIFFLLFKNDKDLFFNEKNRFKNFVPYLEKRDELKQMTNIILRKCSDFLE
jgi:hypothetical protein